MDQFADRRNAVCERFNSMFPQRGAEDWRGELNWINAPWMKLAQVVHKLEAEPGAAAIVIAPMWPSAIWWVPL